MYRYDNELNVRSLYLLLNVDADIKLLQKQSLQICPWTMHLRVFYYWYANTQYKNMKKQSELEYLGKEHLESLVLDCLCLPTPPGCSGLPLGSALRNSTSQDIGDHVSDRDWTWLATCKASDLLLLLAQALWFLKASQIILTALKSEKHCCCKKKCNFQSWRKK